MCLFFFLFPFLLFAPCCTEASLQAESDLLLLFLFQILDEYFCKASSYQDCEAMRVICKQKPRVLASQHTSLRERGKQLAVCFGSSSTFCFCRVHDPVQKMSCCGGFLDFNLGLKVLREGHDVYSSCACCWLPLPLMCFFVLVVIVSALRSCCCTLFSTYCKLLHTAGNPLCLR